ncbi:hypothetical protein RUND412_005772 [Rhizina undulata]
MLLPRPNLNLLTCSALISIPYFTMTAAITNKLFVGSYSGKISTLEFCHSDNVDPTLKLLSYTNVSFPTPSWQEVRGDILYTVEENTTYSAGGGVRSYSINDDGSLTPLYAAVSLLVPVSLDFNHGRKVLFTANYNGAGVSTYIVDPDIGRMTPLTNFTFTLPGPATDPVRQDEPHPHQSLFEPTGRFNFVPDLGSDLVRVFKVTESGTNDTVEIETLAPIPTKSGMGPRHGIFWPKAGRARWYYLVGELDNEVAVYNVTYTDGGEGIVLREVQREGTFPGNATLGSATPNAAEIVISPDFTNLYVTNRNDHPTFFPTDSIAVYSIDPCSGKLTFKHLTPSGVFNPRHFTIDPSGEWVFVAGQDSGNVVVLKRDLGTGELSRVPVAAWEEEKVQGRPGPVCVTWWK